MIRALHEFLCLHWRSRKGQKNLNCLIGAYVIPLVAFHVSTFAKIASKYRQQSTTAVSILVFVPRSIIIKTADSERWQKAREK